MESDEMRDVDYWLQCSENKDKEIQDHEQVISKAKDEIAGYFDKINQMLDEGYSSPNPVRDQCLRKRQAWKEYYAMMLTLGSHIEQYRGQHILVYNISKQPSEQYLSQYRKGGFIHIDDEYYEHSVIIGVLGNEGSARLGELYVELPTLAYVSNCLGDQTLHTGPLNALETVAMNAATYLGKGVSVPDTSYRSGIVFGSDNIREWWNECPTCYDMQNLTEAKRKLEICISADRYNQT